MSLRAWVAFVALSLLWGLPYLFIKLALEGSSAPGWAPAEGGAKRTDARGSTLVGKNRELRLRPHRNVTQAAAHDAGRLGVGVHGRIRRVPDVHDLRALAAQQVGDQRAVASPPEQLRAEDRRATPAGELAKLRQARREFLRWWTPQRAGELRDRLALLTNHTDEEHAA